MVLDKEQIQKQAKQLLDKFASALEKVEDEIKEESYVDREEFEREEGKGSEYDSKFKQKLLQNAPQHDDDFVIVEKGSWKS
ncbi:MAG: Asp-tRNA(Asn) amidotransferase subunit GatC [Nanoarchaeota archaeon]